MKKMKSKIADKVESIWLGVLSPYIALTVLVEKKDKHTKLHSNTAVVFTSRIYVIPPHRVPKDFIEG